MENFLKETFSFWQYLKEDEKERIKNSIITANRKKGTLLTHGVDECTGIMAVKSGRVRIFIASQNGGEITLYRLTDGESCILSAACMMKNISFTITMELEEDTEFVIIPKSIFKQISDNNIKVKDYVLEAVSQKLSDIMWIFSQFVFSNMATRLAEKLLEHSELTNSNTLSITHDILAKDLGTAREVVTRLLKQFQINGLVELSRGKIQLLDIDKLAKI